MPASTLYVSPHRAAKIPSAKGRKPNRLVQFPELGNALFMSNDQTLFPVTPGSFPNGMPTASAAYAGIQAYVPGASGAADTLVICLKAAAGTWSWKTIATG